jgi:hypothetical protein
MVGGGIVNEILILGITTQKGHFAAGSNKRHSTDIISKLSAGGREHSIDTSQAENLSIHSVVTATTKRVLSP